MRGEAKATILQMLAQGFSGWRIHKLTGYCQSYIYRLKGECSPNVSGQEKGKEGIFKAHAPCPKET